MVKDSNKGALLAVKVIPKSARNLVIGWENDSLKIKLRAVPEKGSANEELIQFLSECLEIPKSKILLISGATSRHKRICFLGIAKATIEQKLLDIL